MTMHILEQVKVVTGFVPADMSLAANTGDRVSLQNYNRCAVLLFKRAGTADQDSTLTLTQAKDVIGTGAKALNFTRIDVKQGAQAGIGTFTTITQAAGNTYTEATAAEIQAIWVIDVPADTLDINSGFVCVRADVADVGVNAQLGGLLYLLHDPHHAAAPLPSAIV